MVNVQYYNAPIIVLYSIASSSDSPLSRDNILPTCEGLETDLVLWSSTFQVTVECTSLAQVEPKRRPYDFNSQFTKIFEGKLLCNCAITVYIFPLLFPMISISST